MQEISSPLAPQAIGPYSQAIETNEYVFCSGQIPIDPNTGDLIDGDIGQQAAQVINNLKAVLEQGKLSLNDVIKTEVFLCNMEDFSAMNAVYGKYFATKPYPARVTVEVSRLPKNALIEISCIARKKTRI